ncbi:hypothetical protein BU25DRAFT_458963 [Macroventuria anomochaeta]|uniref:Uncharacterized protein n=1 Tax=Macroventuria anomochaeta TaxID=301207 RepID=A0ACB6RZ59_9PLEO|nr:uncharacterized protein BU25DRAFT_458963 [Macroventuria anomochaeta]KAF2627166.1 hypothetical protein BU25DRAFT_458963 [Macroventuria anomochaeta]
MGRHGRLTHERLVTSLERLHGAVGVQFPDSKDFERAQNLQRVIKNALTAARAGMSGASAATPVQLKREVEARIVEIHERHNEIDEQEEHANKDTANSALHSSAANINHPSLNPSMWNNAAPRRTPCTPDSGKENTTPPAAPSQHPATRKSSAVKKTTITKRVPSSKPSTIAGIKKRPSRTTRTKPAAQLPITTPLLATDEEDRRAAAAALLGLAEHSPDSSFIARSSSSDITPSTGGKRARCVYEDDVIFNDTNHSQEFASSSPVQKRRVLGPGVYAPVPRLSEGVGVKQGFAMGVDYALQQLSNNEKFRGEELRAWVGKELGLQDSPQLYRHSDMDHNGDGRMMAVQYASRGTVDVGLGNGGGGRKGFWDVV